MEKFYTIKEIAQMLQVTPAAIYKWMRQGRLKYVQVGDVRRIKESDLQSFMKPGNPEEEKGNRKPLLVAAYS